MLAVRHILTSRINEIASDEFVETLVVMPSIRMAQAHRAARALAGRTLKDGLLVVAEDDRRLGFIATANLVHSRIRSRYTVYLAQDAFAGFYWLDLGIYTLEETGAGLLAFCDGVFFEKVAAFGLVRREWTDSLYGNLLFHPQYVKHYADLELSDIARNTGNLAYNQYSVMMEIDYERTPEQLAPHSVDGELYVKRALTGFDQRIEPFMPTVGPVAAVVASLAEESLPKDPDRSN